MTRLLLLAGVAALFLATGTAHSEPALPPTDPLIGSWCEQGDLHNRTYKRGSCDALTITKNGSGGVEESCTFINLKRIPNGVEALELCNLDGEMRVEKSIYQIIHGRLQIKIIFSTKEAKPLGDGVSGCASVSSPPDGFLNLRMGPGLAFKVKAKLNVGDLIRVDARNDEWTHVTAVVEDNSWNKTDGWVYTKYVDSNVSCHFP